ncbi:MAG: sigma-54 dependent transcriptional regulator [Candidatus Omnitrophica bacterium]|nr:sigma-54 dependent transcriptional regulator [Candidatus Omnitrophota bacterium]MCM8798114.1 sigma-54 dependent transcriptional regulator [Candidatus Omnitrophota bacterium]
MPKETGERPFPEIVGESPKMLEVFEIMQKVIKTDSTVLITGETGTGKELVARAIHYNGKRRDGAFVAVNCSALTETLLETELFGHVKGSFTGAIAEKKGLFEVADKGTFFMDEIGDISQNLQAKLLRVLQEGVIKKVGGTQDIRVDVRLIAATNRDLTKEVDRGSFRRDLYYRISVVEIPIPPLRERKEDISLLADYFLKRFSQKINKEIKGFSPAALKLLYDYDWPGNVRELEHEIERAVILTETNEITPDDLSERIRSGGMALKIEEIKTRSLKGVLSNYEKKIIGELLTEMRWNKTKVSEVLGITRQALNKKIERYDLDRRKKRA